MEVSLVFSITMPLPVAITIAVSTGAPASLDIYKLALDSQLLCPTFNDRPYFLYGNSLNSLLSASNGYLPNSSRYKFFNRLTVGSVNDKSGNLFNNIEWLL